jgi:hypothetical protein
MKVYASPFAKAGGPLAPVLSQRYLSSASGLGGV